jgi:hypothetical protein
MRECGRPRRPVWGRGVVKVAAVEPGAGATRVGLPGGRFPFTGRRGQPTSLCTRGMRPLPACQLAGQLALPAGVLVPVYGPVVTA